VPTSGTLKEVNGAHNVGITATSNFAEVACPLPAFYRLPDLDTVWVRITRASTSAHSRCRIYTMNGASITGRSSDVVTSTSLSDQSLRITDSVKARGEWDVTY